MGKYAKLYNTKNASDPDVQVFGIGIMRLSQLKKNVTKKLESLVAFAESEDFEQVAWAIDPKSTSPLFALTMAIKDVEEELENLAKLVKK